MSLGRLRRNSHKGVTAKADKEDRTMKKTSLMASIKAPMNYWISRRVWEDANGGYCVCINGGYVRVTSLLNRGWIVKYC